MPKLPEIVPVILAGGNGSRLRPLTGPGQPKPFLRLFSQYSLFQETVLRARAFAPPVVVCHESHGATAAEHLEEIRVQPSAIILEPESRNTAAAVAAAAFYLAGRDALMLVTPSDHYMPDGHAFVRAVQRAAASAAAGTLMMIGVKASRPETRFGYIEARGAGYISGVKRFVEKPDLQTAKELVAGGKCCWNTGIFLVRPLTFLNQLARQKPEIYKALDVACQAATRRGNTFAPQKSSFIKALSTSVDYAVLEGCKEAGLVNLNAPWDDIGHWPSLLRLKAGTLWANNNKKHERRRGQITGSSRYGGTGRF